MENTFTKEWWEENLHLNEDNINSIIEKVVKGFELVPVKDGFEKAYTTKNGKATIELAKRIYSWIQSTFPNNNVGIRFEKVHNTINFYEVKNTINEGLDKNLLKEFIKFTVDYLKIKNPHGILSLSKDTNKARERGSFGTFSPDDNNVWVYTKNRNMADTCRTIAHEYSHFKQMEDGKDMNGETGSDVEKEANALAGEIMREFGQKNPLIYEGLTDHAQLELQRAGLFDKDADYGGMIGEAVLELIKTMSKQGHSGMSAKWVRELFNKLSNYENLTPLTSEDFVNVSEYGSKGDEPLYQNKRNSAVFCTNPEDKKTWYHVDGEVIKEGIKIGISKYKQMINE